MHGQKRKHIAGLALLLALHLSQGTSFAADAALAQAGAAQSEGNGKSWFGNQLTRFKSYPHLDMAYRLIGENKLEEAKKELEAYLKLTPGDVKARGDYMTLLYNMKRYDEAKAQARSILDARPDDPAALLTFGLCLMRAGEYQAALDPLQEAISHTVGDASRQRFAKLAVADALTRLGRFKEALELLETLPEPGGDYELQYAKGVVLDKTGNIKGAREAFANALAAADSDKDRLAALRSLAVTAVETGDVAAAGDHLAKALALAPRDPDVLRQKAQLASNLKEFEEAARLGRELVALAPTPDNKIFLANVLASLKQYDAAAGEIAPLLAAGPGPEEAFHLNMQLGLLYLEANKPEAAVTALQKAVALRRDALALLRLSRALQRAGRPTEAVRALADSTALAASPETLVELATLLARLDDGAAALAALDKALAEAPPAERRGEILAMKGMLLGEKGDFAGARRALEEALAADAGQKAQRLMTLGELCLRQGDVSAAEAAFRAAVAAGGGRDAERSLAETLVKAAKPGQALDVYQTLAARASDPGQAAADRLSLANVLSRLGRHAEAARIFADLAAGGRPELLRQAGQSYAAARQNDQAVAMLTAYLAKAGSPSEKAETLLALGHIHAARRDYVKAYEAFRTAQPLAAGLSADKRAEIALGLGTAALLSGKAAKAVEPLSQALGLLESPARKAEALLTLAQAQIALGDPQKAIAALRRAVATPGAPRTAVATASESLGYLLSEQGDLTGAEAVFRRVLESDGGNGPVLSALGQIAFKLGRYQEAADDFSKSLSLRNDVRTRIGLARTYDKLGKPGLALAALTEAGPGVPGLPAPERRDYFLALGFLYATEFRYELAVAAFKDALALGYDSETATRLGRLLRLAGQPAMARQTLEAVDPSRLPQTLKLLRLSELASLAEAEKNYDAAKTLLEAAQAIQPDADAAFRLGNVLRDSGHPREAVDAYWQAVRMEDANRYLTALGYGLSDLGQWAEAKDVFAKVLARDPDYLRLWEDLGYAAMHDCDNAKAVAGFRQAIDNAPLEPVDNAAQKEKRDQDVYRMRKEVTKLETNLVTTVYMSYIAGDAGPQPSSGGESADVIRANSGVEVAWIPPVIGFRDDRIFQVVGRVNGNLQKESLQFDKDSWQGAIGVRYKPFKTQNLNLGFERLFKIGQAAEENWLFRAMHSWTDGYDVKPKETWWNYSFLYGEYDYYLEHDRRSMFYAEGRQGVSFNFGDRFLLTPHVVVDARLWSPDGNQSSYVEGGGGLSFKYLFNRAQYEIERSSVEFLLQYKYGTLFNKTNVKDRENVINALFLTSIVRF
jgi:tetratricopeptide (TPR) repeat protein